MNKKALTLIELLMVMLMLFLVMGTLITAFLAGASVFNTELNMTDVMIEANRGMDLASRELRNSLEITSATSTSISFWGEDINSNGTKESAEVISYAWDGTANGELVRTAGGTPSAISRNVNGFELSYNSPSVSSIDEVTIKLTIARGAEYATLESTVKPRNL